MKQYPISQPKQYMKQYPISQPKQYEHNINSFRGLYGEILPETKNSMARACEGHTIFVEGNISSIARKKS